MLCFRSHLVGYVDEIMIIISNLLYIVTSTINTMNKVLFITAVALVFASALVSTGAMQSAHACPDKSSAATSKVNPATPSNAQLTQPSSPQLAIGHTA
jgi:hypothetical protein